MFGNPNAIELRLGDVTYLTSPNYPQYYVEEDAVRIWHFTSPDPGYYEVSVIAVDVWNLFVGVGQDVTWDNTVGRYYWSILNTLTIRDVSMWVEYEMFADWPDPGFFLKIKRTSGKSKLTIAYKAREFPTCRKLIT